MTAFALRGFVVSCLLVNTYSDLAGTWTGVVHVPLHRRERSLSIDETRNVTGRLVPIVRQPPRLVRRYRHSLLAEPSGAGHDIPLEGNTVEYFCTIQIGVPGQSFTVQVDTGSSLLAVPDASCTTCCCTTCYTCSGYNVSSSESGQRVACDGSGCSAHKCYADTNYCSFNISYGDGASVAGAMATDLVQLGAWTESTTGTADAVYSVTVPFGSIFVENFQFQRPPVVGIWGMAYSNGGMECYPSCVTPLLDAMVSQAGMPNVFSMRLQLVLNGVQLAGSLVLGGEDYPGTLVYTPILEQTYYIVGLSQMLLGDAVVDDSSEDHSAAVVDSGTTMLILSSTAYSNIQQEFQTNYCHLEGICGNSSIFDGYCIEGNATNIFDGWPNITLRLDGVQLTLLPKYYMPALVKNPGKNVPVYCLGLQTGNPDMHINILGDTFMRAFYVVFDRVNSRVGFGELDPGTVVPLQSAIPVPFWFLPMLVVAGFCVALVGLGVAMGVYWRRCRTAPQADGYQILSTESRDSDL